ncbi:MAG: AAA family ATPase [Rhodocyclales bacterium]|nr:AAA family ATPase [Rhodocyclales bacterium]
MYQDFFRLKEPPFSIAPDPRFLYMSARHREAIAHLLYGVGGDGGFVLLTGEIGTGKTTLCRRLLEQINTVCDVAIILNPKLSVEELLETVCNEFHIPLPQGRRVGVKVLVDAINFHLLDANARGRRAVLIIDEAQNLQPEVLEQLRLLTNLETNTRKLLQIILIGQPELGDMLERWQLRQVAQRVVARYHLTHLTRDEVATYVNHRLRVAGGQAELFPPALIGQLYRYTRGVPRLINLVCDRALLGTYVQGKSQVTRQTLRQAKREVIGIAAGQPLWRRYGRQLVMIAGLGAGAVVVANSSPFWPTPEPASATARLPAMALRAPEQAGATEQFDGLLWPADAASREDSEKLAVREFLGLYGVERAADASGGVCDAAAANHMRCFRGIGGLADLRRFNQPAILKLESGRGNSSYYGVLLGLDDQGATLSLAGERLRVHLGDLARAWSGHYILLWLEPPGYNAPLALGSRGPAVAQLRRDLARLQGSPSEGPPWFDEDLLQQVKKFQLAEGIAPDGIVGALTMTRINMQLDDSAPRLNAARR